MKRVLPVLSIAAASIPAIAQQQLHFTYMWHLEQPIYWPDRQVGGTDRYERAWETIQRLDGGAPHPQDNLRSIFGLDDRVAVYQYRVRDSISAISAAPEAGAQVSYSGGLIAAGCCFVFVPSRAASASRRFFDTQRDSVVQTNLRGCVGIRRTDVGRIVPVGNGLQHTLDSDSCIGGCALDVREF